jgi:hypothetical protein
LTFKRLRAISAISIEAGEDTSMPAQDGVDDAARLEAALQRIAKAAQRPVPATAPDAHHGADTTELARRLDTLIGTLRDALSPSSP